MHNKIAHSQAIFSMHHRLQTLTKRISNYSQSLTLAIESLPLPESNHKQVADHLKDLHRHLNVINDSIKFQENLINQTPRIVKFNPKEIITGLVSTYQSDKGITMIPVCPEAGKLVFGNLHNLKRILTNLLSNAEKFTPSGGKITIALTYPESLSPEADIPLEFSISDTGPGMTEAVMQRIFIPYAQGGSEISGQYGGTGLGLTTCRRLVEELGGKISVSSIIGKGSSFTFTIVCHQQIPTEEKTAPLTSSPASEQSILASMHDVRNVTGWLLSYSGFIKNSIEILKQLSMRVGDIEKLAQAIEDCTESQRHLITQTLDYSKLSLGKTELHIVNFNPKKIVSDIVSTSNKKDSVSIVARYPKENKDLSGDPEKLTQILTNLISHAIKLSHKPAEITISFIYTDSPLTLEFKLSTPVSGRLESKYTDADLDLPICNEIISLLKGTISTSPTQDQEWRFTFTIPYQLPNLLLSIKKRKRPSLPKLEAKDARVLVVEDQPINRKLVIQMLQRLRYKNITEAQSGKDALDKYSEFKIHSPPFHLILMDVQMSPINGIEATQQIRKKEVAQQKIPAHIVGISGNSDDQEKQEAMAAGMNEYLVKPATLALLKKSIPAIKKPSTSGKSDAENKQEIAQSISKPPVQHARNTPRRSISDSYGSLFYRHSFTAQTTTATSTSRTAKSGLTRSVSGPVSFRFCNPRSEENSADFRISTILVKH